MSDDAAPWFDAALSDLAPESAALVRAELAGKPLEELGDPAAASRVFSEYLLCDGDIRYIRTLVGWDGWVAPRTWTAGDLATWAVMVHAIRLHQLRRKALRTRPYRNASNGVAESPAGPVSCRIP